jgi:hypothetical protein
VFDEGIGEMMEREETAETGDGSRRMRAKEGEGGAKAALALRGDRAEEGPGERAIEVSMRREGEGVVILSGGRAYARD